VGWVLMQPPTYDSTVRLWTERQTLVPNPNDNPYVTPAQEQASVLTELLNTKYFCVKVGSRSPLAESLASSSGSRPGPVQQVLSKLGLGGAPAGHLSGRALDDAVFQAVSRQTTVVPAGPEIVAVTFRGGSPELASQVAQAVADQFIEETLTSQRVQASAAVDFYASQVKQAQTDLQAADTQVDQYLSAHPEQRVLNAVPDARMTQLRKDDDAARQRYTDLQSKLDQAKVNASGLDQPSVSGIRTLDKAEVPTKASSVKTVALQAAAAGLGLAVLILVAGVLVLTMVDSTVRRPEEVEQVLALRPVGTVPRLN
jgi:uncharacterized protein involved in exopolysaccharide biosynthesis